MSEEELKELEDKIKTLEGIEDEILSLRGRARPWGVDRALLDAERTICQFLNDCYIERARATRSRS